MIKNLVLEARQSRFKSEFYHVAVCVTQSYL